MKRSLWLSLLVMVIMLLLSGWLGWLAQSAHTMGNQPPLLIAPPTANPALPLLGEQFTMQVAAADPDGDPLTYTWDMGDGLRVQGNPITWRYSLEVTYTVTVTINDGQGGIITTTVPLNITRNPVLDPPIQPPLFAPGWTTGTKTVLVILVSFADLPLTGTNPTTMADLTDQTGQFWHDNSYGLADFSTIATTPILLLPTSTTDYPVPVGNAPLIRDSLNRFRRDVRNLARTAGYDPDAYDLDIIVHPPHFMASSANNGNRGLLLENYNFAALSHESGHNLGLRHATNWNTTQAGLTVIGPGQYINYGNAFDMMGVGGDARYHFTAYAKERLGWLSPEQVTVVNQSNTYRLYAHDSPTVTAGRVYLLRVPRDVRDYWLEYRQLFPINQWTTNGVLIGFTPWPGTAGTPPLLDMTPGSPYSQYGLAGDTNDSALVIGRTFADTQAQWFITPVGVGGSTPDRYIDVVMNKGPFAGNVAPTSSLAVSSLNVPVNSSVYVTATASDANGDSLAYYWDWGDAQFGSANSPTMSHQWGQAGDYGVRLTVSDMKGGTVSRLVVMRVGSPGTYRISGTISGGPGEGLRVTATLAGQTVTTMSDSDGHYTLTGLSNGTYQVQPAGYGYGLTPGNQVVVVNGGDVNGVNFAAAFLNTAPSLQPLANQTFAEDSLSQPITVTLGDSQTNAGALLVWADSNNPTLIPPRNVVITGNSANRTLEMLPLFDQTGTALITVTVSDGLALVTRTFVATVTAVNDAPVAGFDTYGASGMLGVNAAAGLLSNDTDIENQPLTASLFAGPLHGSLQLNADGSFTYQPDPNFVGLDYFFYQADDTVALSGVTTVTILVTPTPFHWLYLPIALRP
ncbi:MAG: PKD domain-containing protein [Chloroflexi bacterium]|nr:PKD domain-containing protein [Chloroflexota bacterium]